jgi:ATP-dependent DNA helicase RecG
MFDTKKIKSIIAQGEGLNIEFKKAYEALPRNVFETICAFLNRKGGYILLGVADNGNIEGIKEDTLQTQLKTLANDMNNPQIISPTFYLSSETVEIEEKKIICVFVPESSQVHAYKGIYFDRNQDGDYKLTNQHLIMSLYVRKYDGFTENKVFPHLQMEHLEPECFNTVRNQVKVERPDHPWINMSNEEILRSAKMYLTDIHTNQSGYTLAAALVFGTEATIRSVCGHYKTDALCRKENVDRYDDRDVITCNLIEAYSRLMAFIRKHTPDRFYLEGNQRRSIRELIFREMVANLLVHREFSIPYPARLTIYKETVVSENWTIPNAMGLITPDNVVPHPKNPTISDFFRQLGWVEDLGSGIRNMFKYCPIYVKDALPVMEEGDIFKLTVRYEKENASMTQSSEKDTTVVNIKHADKILELIRENSKITAISIGNKLSLSENHIRKILARLVLLKMIERKGSDKEGEWIISENDRVK